VSVSTTKTATGSVPTVSSKTHWINVCPATSVPDDAGVCVLIDGVQIAVFHIAARDAWYAIQNRCPHWNEMVLWRGLTGEQDGEAKVACPMHKRTFALASGKGLSDDEYAVQTFDVRVVGGEVQIAQPSDEWLAEERARTAECSGRHFDAAARANAAAPGDAGAQRSPARRDVA
jgi:nitrite reductase (NADH) small subunit